MTVLTIEPDAQDVLKGILQSGENVVWAQWGFRPVHTIDYLKLALVFGFFFPAFVFNMITSFFGPLDDLIYSLLSLAGVGVIFFLFIPRDTFFRSWLYVMTERRLIFVRRVVIPKPFVRKEDYRVVYCDLHGARCVRVLPFRFYPKWNQIDFKAYWGARADPGNAFNDVPDLRFGPLVYRIFLTSNADDVAREISRRFNIPMCT